MFCFYPMTKRREAHANWYATPFDERNDMMREHGKSGRTFAGKVVQLITGSTGLDDFEWGVTLFATTPEVVKDVVYTMRFDKGSALYGEFGRFYVGYLAVRRRDPRRLGPLTLPASRRRQRRRVRARDRDVDALIVERPPLEAVRRPDRRRCRARRRRRGRRSRRCARRRRATMHAAKSRHGVPPSLTSSTSAAIASGCVRPRLRRGEGDQVEAVERVRGVGAGRLAGLPVRGRRRQPDDAGPQLGRQGGDLVGRHRARAWRC